MIHEEICTYEVCKLAKENGFSLPCLYHFNKDGNLKEHYDYDADNSGIGVGELLRSKVGEEDYLAPTQSLLQRWLREEKGIIIDVVLDWSYNLDFEEIRYQYRIGGKDRLYNGSIETKGIVFNKYFPAYELALEDALKYALENLVN